VIALGHSPLELKVHESHFGPTGRQTVCLAEVPNYYDTLPVDKMETYLTKANKHMVDFTVKFSGQPRLEVQPGFFRVLWGLSVPP